MIPPSWRLCDECGAKDDVERVDGKWICIGCRLRASAIRRQPRRAWWWVLPLALSACGGVSERSTPAPAPAACVEVAWSLEYCEARRYPQTVELGCEEPPRDACAWAERSGRPDAWCCW